MAGDSLNNVVEEKFKLAITHWTICQANSCRCLTYWAGQRPGPGSRTRPSFARPRLQIYSWPDTESWRNCIRHSFFSGLAGATVLFDASFWLMSRDCHDVSSSKAGVIQWCDTRSAQAVVCVLSTFSIFQGCQCFQAIAWFQALTPFHIRLYQASYITYEAPTCLGLFSGSSGETNWYPWFSDMTLVKSPSWFFPIGMFTYLSGSSSLILDLGLSHIHGQRGCNFLLYLIKLLTGLLGWLGISNMSLACDCPSSLRWFLCQFISHWKIATTYFLCVQLKIIWCHFSDILSSTIGKINCDINEDFPL